MLYAVGTIGNLSLYGADGPEIELSPLHLSRRTLGLHVKGSVRIIAK